MTDAKIKGFFLHDVSHFGLRTAIGVIFILHSLGKFEPGFVEFLGGLGLPPELQYPIALAEFVPGILLIIGVLTRISSGLLSVIMLGAIFLVKGAEVYSGRGGVEYDVLLLAGLLVTVVIGPGRISFVHIIKKIPRILH